MPLWSPTARRSCATATTRTAPAPPAPTPALTDFHLLRVIGNGAHARVRLVQHKASRATYALKYVDKARAAAAPVLQERRLLEETDHPFLVNMHFAFQDAARCYFVLDLMLGGDLRFHRLRRGSLGEDAVRFYVAEISSALAYLHQIGISHRDVKPENILLDLDGHAHLTDFNVAVRFSRDTRHSAVAGTMVYMAPEMLARTGYSWPVDYWALGVTAYECLFGGHRPFADGTADAARLAHAIQHDALAFPADADRVCSAAGRAALAALLARDPAARLGCRAGSRARGTAQLRAHAWFRATDWARLGARALAPPFVPDARAWNFDAAPRRRPAPPAGAAPRTLAARFAPFDGERMRRRSDHPPPERLGAAAAAGGGE